MIFNYFFINKINRDLVYKFDKNNIIINKMQNKHMIILMSFIVLFSMSLQDNQQMDFSRSYKGELEQDQHTFYSVVIPPDVKVNTTNLIISINGDNCEEGTDKCTEFYDPDVYVSLENERPIDKSTSTWYSESYGSDIISIGSDNVSEGRRFYLGVYCQYKCKYILKAELKNLIELKAGETNRYTIKKDHSLSFRFTALKDYRELMMSFMGFQMKSYQVLVTNTTNPAYPIQMTLQPSWISGYVLNIHKDSQSQTVEQFDILIRAEEETNIRFFISYPETEYVLNPTEGLLNSVETKKPRCFAFPLTNYKNENIILHLMLFSGSAILRIEGFKKTTEPYDQIPRDENTFDVFSEKLVILKKKDIDQMKRASSESNNLRFCVYGKKPASFRIKAHYDTQVESLQKYNFHLIGTTTYGYLPSNKVTKYRLIDFTSDSNLTITLDTKEGDAVLYGAYSEDVSNKLLTFQSLDEMIDKKGPILEALETFSGFEIVLNNTDNKCYQKRDENQKQPHKLSCSFYAIISCESTEDCIYTLRTTNNKNEKRLVPRTALYNILPKDKSDYYRIEIDDENITLLTVVLNTISGETELKVNFTSYDLANPNKHTYISKNKGYLPNVINVTPSRIKGNNIKGSYVFEVFAQTFSTYSIYYYTNSTDFDKTKPDWSSVTLKIERGQIIYEIFQKKSEYKIYSYTHSGKKSDIIITLTRRNTHCAFYVFLDLNTFKYKTDPDSYEKIDGYDWRSGWNNQLIISQNDLKFSDKGTYYIVVARYLVRHEDKNEDGYESFSLGVTNEDTDFILYEGVQHSATFEKSYKSQGYWYTHESIDKPFSLALNTNYGNVNVYIDFKPITRERIANKETIYYSKIDQKTDYITINPDELRANCFKKTQCNISIYLEQKDLVATQYLIIAKSGRTRTEYLTSGVLVPNTLQVKEKQHYIIEEYSLERQGSIYVNFNDGVGRVYLSLTSKTFVNENDFPNEKDHQFRGEDDYHGQLISIPKNEIAKCLPLCKFLVTITGEQLGYMSNAIQYSILYSAIVQKLTLNVPTFDIITNGILQYYQFRIGSEAKNVYVSLYNMKGDTELYINHGETKPDFNRHHWRSINPSHDFINFNIEDPYFVDAHLNTLEGVYTICVYAYSNTTYNIFVTDNEYKILPIGNNKPGSCKCAEQNDKCHFKMDNIVTQYPGISIDNVSVVFTTNFHYGSGNIYVNLLNETDYDTITKFPSKEKYDYSNLEKKKKNFLKINIKEDNPNLTINSTLLIIVDCLEKSLFDINAAKLTNSTTQSIDVARENIFYLKKRDTETNNTKILFFNYQEKDINYEIYSYTGKGEIRVYQNYSIFDQQSSSYKNEYKHIAQFFIEPTTSYYNTIRNYDKVKNRYIYFEVTPQTNFGFYVKLNYDQELTMVKIGRIDSYVLSHNIFYGYFDLLEEYKEVVLNVRCENPKTIATVSTKLNFISKDKTNQGNQLEMPNGNDKNSVTTNALLSHASIRIEQVDENGRKGKLVRVIFKVELQSNNYLRTNTNVIDILVTPEVNYYKRIAAKPSALYFGNEKPNNKDTTIFDISKLNKEDDVIVIELSPCDGEIDFRLTNEISYFNTDRKGESIKFSKSLENGKIKLAILNSTVDSYYLNVWGVKVPEDFDSIEYLMYYYSTTNSSYGKQLKSNAFVYNYQGKGKLLLELPEIRRINNNLDYTTLSFDVFVTSNQTDYSHMDSLCYLSRYQHKFKRAHYYYSSATHKLEITDLNTKEDCYLNVRIIDNKTGEMYILKSSQIQFNEEKSSLPTWFIVLIVLGLIGVSGLLFFYFRKYKMTKDLLQYEMNDVRNQGQVPKSEAELHEITQNQKKQKYVPLSEEPSKL